VTPGSQRRLGALGLSLKGFGREVGLWPAATSRWGRFYTFKGKRKFRPEPPWVDSWLRAWETVRDVGGTLPWMLADDDFDASGPARKDERVGQPPP
jgi:hypothetical protein